jgi:YHS domain-containing protein
MKVFFLRQTLLAALISGASLLALLPTPAQAYDVNSSAALNVDAKGIAVQGYDVVAYQSGGTPTPGQTAFTAAHEGATYLFSSAAHRDLLKANPAKYAPQFGGFCAMGVALEKKLDGDPLAWRVVDGKLYLNVNKDVQKKWLEDVPGHVKAATATWPQIKAKAPKDL